MTSWGRVPFVARSGELSVLTAALDRSGHNVPRVLLVRGPAGIGKSALVREFLTTVGAEVRTVRAGASEIETALAFGLASQLVDDDETADRDPLDVGGAILRNLGRGDRVVAIVEDVHWADQSSLAALFFALRRLRADPVLVVLTSRDVRDGVPDALAAALEGVVAAVDGAVIDLPGLDDAAVAQLVVARGGPEPGHGGARRLRAHTAGNPLHLRVLLDEYPDAPTHGDDAVPLPAPGSFADLVRVRLAPCSARDREILQAAAVLGPSGPVARVAGVADATTSEVLATVEAGARASVLQRPVGRLREVTFAHPLLRAALYHDLPLDRRRRLHQRAARVLAAEPAAADPAAELELLRHEVAASAGPEPALGDRMEAAADRAAATGAWAESAAALLAARELAAEPATADRRLAIAVERLVLAGDVTEAIALAPALDATPAGARRDYTLGLLGLFTGLRGEAEARLVRAWERSGDDRALAGAAAAQVATLAVNDGRGEETVRWARRAQTEGVDGLLNARVMLMLALGCLGRSDEALREVGHLPPEPALVEARDADGLLGRGVLRLWTDRLTLARADLAAAGDLFAARGPLHMRLIALYYLADAEYRAGHWDEAAARGAFAAALADDAEQAWTAPLVHGIAALPFAGRGDWEVAGRHVRIAREAAEAQDNPAGRLWAAVAGARLAQARGDAAGLVAATDGVSRVVGADGWQDPGIQPWEHLRVEGLVGLGRLDEAERTLAGLEPLVAAQDHDSAVLATVRVRALLCGALGDSAAALRSCDGAAERTAAVGGTRPFEAALLDLTHGGLLRRAGRRRDAAERLDLARHRLTRLGAVPFLGRCERELAACGRSSVRRAGHAGPVLTPQERTIAALVASGATNREVATELIVSVKTVEYHLGHVFTKLDVRTRAALAARWAAGAG